MVAIHNLGVVKMLETVNTKKGKQVVSDRKQTILPPSTQYRGEKRRILGIKIGETVIYLEPEGNIVS